MKHIKKFENFDISDTEDPEITSKKIDWNSMSKWVSEFNTKKGIVDNLYASYRDIKELRNNLVSKGIATKEGEGVRFENPLLAIWAKAASKNRKIIAIEKSLALLNNTLKENSTKLSKDPDIKDVVEQQNKSINDSIALKKLEIQNLNKDILKTEQEVKEKIDELKDKIKNDQRTLKA